MSWIETLRTGVAGVLSHRLRSALTVLGILIGIAAVILTVGLGEGAQGQVTSEITALGSNVLTVTPGSTTSSTGIREALGSASTLTMSDVSALASKVDAPDVKAVAPITSSSEELVAGSDTWTTSVQGSTASWLTVRGRTLAQGRFIDNQDVSDHTAVGRARRYYGLGAVPGPGPGGTDRRRRRRRRAVHRGRGPDLHRLSLVVEFVVGPRRPGGRPDHHGSRADLRRHLAQLGELDRRAGAQLATT